MRDTILIVDDELLNRELLRQIFEDSYQIVMAENGQEAIELFDGLRSRLAAVLLDYVMPLVNGHQVLLALSAAGETDTIPVIMITASVNTETTLECFGAGAAEVIHKPFVAGIVRQKVLNMIELYSSREQLRYQLDDSEKRRVEQEKQLKKFNNSFIDAISNVIEFRDYDSGQHIKRVKGITGILARSYAKLYPECGLDSYTLDIIVKSAALHDLGKIVIPNEILFKPGRLTPEERAIMETHTTRGCDVLAKLEDVQDMDHYKIAYEIVRYHHERYDGNGYPDKLKGDEIPLSAQLVSVADVYDALTSERVYKKAYSNDRAYEMIMGGECGVFAPKLLNCLTVSRKVIELFVDSIKAKGEFHE